MKTFFRIVIVCLFSGQLLAQADTILLRPHKKINISDIALVSTDNLQNIIVADKNGSVTAFNYNGKVNNQNAFDRFASISSLDASLSFNILIFYKDLNQCIFVDRLLRPISEITFPYNYSLATSANNGDLWLFNEKKYSIDKYSPVLQQIISEVFLKVHLNKESVVSIKEYNHLLTVNTNQSIYFFSHTGELQHKFPLTKHTNSYIAQSSIWILQQGLLHKKALYKNEDTFFKLNVSVPIEGFVIPENKNLLILFTKEELFFISLPISAVE